jgi:serine protease Do
MFEDLRPRSRTVGNLGRTRKLAASLALALTLAPIVAGNAGAVAPPGFADVAEQILPAYVDIAVRQRVAVRAPTAQQQQQQQGPFDQFFRDLFDQLPNAQPQERTQNAIGAGFLIDKSGIVVTNNHVVDGADEVRVILHDGTRLLARVLGRDERADLAVLKVEAGRELPALRWGDSDAARIGDWILAVGNPYGFGGSISAGIISARSRDIGATQYGDLIQTDAAINRGNSGGPLLNSSGEVVGVNVAIYSPNGASVGIGFSIPSNMAKPIVQQIIEFGRPRRGWLGVRVQTVTDELAQALGLGRARGALIGGVSEGGPASRGGIVAGDVVLKFAGKEIADMQALPRIVAETAVDATVDVQVMRTVAGKGEVRELKVKVGELTDTAVAALATPPAAARNTTEALGMSLTGLTAELRQQYGVAASTRGVLVTGVTAQTDAALRRIQPGDVILEVASTEVQSPEQVLQLVEQSRAQNRGSVLILLRQRNGEMRFVALSLARG